jgi:DNA-directed RNA polymerase beta subunit
MGDKLFRVNYTDNLNSELKKIAKRLTGKTYSSFVEASEDIREKFTGISFEGGSNEITLGKGYDKVSPSFWLALTAKLRKTAAGIQKPDDVNASYFREYLTPEDNIVESITAATSKFVTRVRRRGGKKDLKSILSASKFEKPIYDLFSSSSLKEYTDQTNPLDWISGEDALTVFGPGGISQARAVSDDMRTLQPTLHGIADPLASPESADKIGVVLHRTVGSAIKGGVPHIKVVDRANKATTISSYAFANTVIGIGDPANKGSISGFKNGIAQQIKASTAKYFMKPESLFSKVSNMIPMLGSTYGVRANVGNKQYTQSLPLKYREAPLVTTQYEQTHSNKGSRDFPSVDMQGNIIAIESGTIQAVRQDKIVLKSLNGTLLDHEYPSDFPLNTESFMDTNVIVKAGDSVKKGQRLADSVFSKDGKLALGTNLKTGFLAYKGYNFEDGFVVSEGAAKKLTSLHLLEFEVEKGKDVVIGKGSYVSLFPGSASITNLANYDDNGLIKEGTIVEYGIPLILAYEKRELTPAQAAISTLNKKISQLLAPRDISPIYNKNVPGVVTRVYQDNKHNKVFVKTEEPAVEGDKMATRYGGKGIITKIVADAQMPVGADGSPLEVLFNPHGIPSRMNPSQMIESSLGKIAKKEGKIYALKQFDERGHVNIAKQEQARSGIHDEETVTDPETGKTMTNVHVGQLYFNKLKHSVRKKIKAGETGYYDVQYEQPKKTETNGTRAIDGLSFYSLLAGGARKNLAEMANIKGTKNDEFWRAMHSGMPLPNPKVPAMQDNFLSSLQALGLNTFKTKDSLALTPSTTEDILKQSNGEIREAKFMRSRDMKPEVGGFYDPALTGGDAGTKWTHISLAEPIPNPIFERAITKTLGITTKVFNAILKGKTKVSEDGTISKDGVLFGGKAIATMLDAINIDKQLKELRAQGKQQGLDKEWGDLNNTNTKIRFLSNIKVLGKKPSELYVLNAFPILPPKFRQMTILPTGTVQNPPINELYQSLKLESDGLKNLKALDFYDDETVGTRIEQLYKHAGAVFGTTDPVSFQLKQRASEKGILRQLAPKSGGKLGVIQQKMMRKKQDISGGSTITVDPNLPLDHVGVPEDMAFKIMKPFITRKMVQNGYTPIKALEAIKDRTPVARHQLDEVMKERPVMVNRHPSLHKFNFMSQWGRVVPGQAIMLNPLVIHGFNADFDGDSMIGDIWLSAPGEYNIDNGDSIVKTKLCITTNIADIPHGDLIERKANKEIYSVPKGMTVPAIAPDGTIELKEVTKFHKHKGCEEWEVKLTGDITLNVSDNHSLVCFNPELNIVEKTKPADASFLCVPRLFDIEYANPNKFEGVSNSRSEQERLHLISSLGFFTGSTRNNKKRVGGYTFSNSTFLEGRARLVNEYKEAHFDTQGRFISPFILNWIDSNVYLNDELRLPSFLIGVSKKEREAFVSGLIEASIMLNKDSFAIRETKNKAFLDDIAKLVQSVGVDGTFTSKKIKNCSIYSLEFKQLDVKNFYLKNAHYFSALSRAFLDDSKLLSISLKAHDFIPVPTFVSMLILETTRFRIDSKMKANKLRYAYSLKSYSDWIELGYEPWTRAAFNFFLSHMTDEELEVLPREYMKLVQNKAVRWGLITSSRKTGRTIDMYDITVKDYKNFATDYGYFVWDTMNMHVPVTEGARLEAARKLMPSNSLFGPDRNILPMPSNEAVLGLYILSKKGKSSQKTYTNLSAAEASFLKNEITLNDEVTIQGKKVSLGWAILYKNIPAKYHSIIKGKSLDKGVIQDLIKAIYKESASKAADLLNTLKDLGNKYVYLAGFSISLNDITTPKALDKQVASLVDVYGKDNKYADNLDKGMAKTQKTFKSFFDKNRLYDMKRSGAKGKWSNLTQMLYTPGFMEGVAGQGLQDNSLSTGYAQGMNASDYINTQFAARSGMISKVRGVAKGGELSKDEVHAGMELVITEKDCLTTKGISLSRTDPFIIGRFLVDGSSPIDEVYLKTHKKKMFLVRSPLTCEAVQGICVKCHGLNDQFRLPTIGDHVGAEAAQVTSESITQGLMRVFHSGKGSEEGGPKTLARDANNLFGKIPNSFFNEAPVAESTGFVTKVEKALGGGWDIHVDDRKYHATDIVNPLVKKDQRVERGQALTTGLRHPRKVLEVEGLLGARKYLTNSMRNLYSSNGISLNPIHFEVLSRSLTEHARVIDPGTSLKYEPGDMEKIAVLDKLNKNGALIKYAARLEGANRVPLLRNDFLAQSARREARTAIPEAAIKGSVAKIRSINPINSWLLGDFKDKPGTKGEF